MGCQWDVEDRHQISELFELHFLLVFFLIYPLLIHFESKFVPFNDIFLHFIRVNGMLVGSNASNGMLTYYYIQRIAESANGMYIPLTPH